MPAFALLQARFVTRRAERYAKREACENYVANHPHNISHLVSHSMRASGTTRTTTTPWLRMQEKLREIVLRCVGASGNPDNSADLMSCGVFCSGAVGWSLG